jgi:hypothetical protein
MKAEEYKDWVYKTARTGCHAAIAHEIMKENEKEIKELKELIVLQDMKIASYLEELGEN